MEQTSRPITGFKGGPHLVIEYAPQALKPRLDSRDIPDASQLRDGLGEIHLEYHAYLPPSTAASRSLVLANRHLNEHSVYLVNVEVPQEQTLRIVDQKRNPRQSVYELDYQQTITSGRFGMRPGIRAWWSAFASTLDRLGPSKWGRVAGILSFNLRIETMQLLVVAVVLPSLLVMSRTSAYSAFRIVGAVDACVASAMWIAKRLFSIQVRVDALVNLIAQRGLVCAGVLFAASLACLFCAQHSKVGVESR